MLGKVLFIFKIMKQKIAVATLRGLSMGFKFLLLIYLSKELAVDEYGTINLFFTSITFFLFIVGFDFYNYSHREILENEEEQVGMLINQLLFHLFCYVAIVPLLFVLFLNNFIPLEYGILFYLILIFEHLCQEAFRLFNLFNKFHHANFTLFLRTAGWIGPLAVLNITGYLGDLTIKKTLFFWLLGSVLSFMFCVIYVLAKKKQYLIQGQKLSIRWRWLKKGVRISTPFFIGTIAYKVIEYSDRFVIDYFLGKESVGVYSFYVNFANIINIVVTTLTFTLLVPNLLRTIAAKNEVEIEAKIKALKKELTRTTLVVIAIVSISIFPVLSWLQKPEFLESYPVFFITVFSNGMLNASLFYHYLLYGFKKDKEIFYPILISSVLNILLNLLFIKAFGIYAAAGSTLLSYGVLWFLKRNNWLHIRNNYE